MVRVFLLLGTTVLVALLAVAPVSVARAADAAFEAFLRSLWPDAQRMGVSRNVFEAATRDLDPDLSLPDLVVPGRTAKPPEQPEFVQMPSEYLREANIARLAAQARSLQAKHRATLARIEAEFGVPPAIVLAIWGRETAFGTYRLPHDAIRVLATQAYLGRRKEQFREEFLLALKMLQDGVVTRGELKSSWAGAMGMTQFLPSEFYKQGVDFDGDGRRDIWKSVPDALASAAKQLVDKGWQPGQRWGYEVRAPHGMDCTIGVPDVTAPLGEWLRRGYVPAYDVALSATERAQEASLLQPEGIYGPAFLAPKNYFVIKSYNFSDLYVLFVGHLADRIADPRPFETPWAKMPLLRTAALERMQRELAARGLYTDKIDGKAGMKTRAAVGTYQQRSGLKVDCWPSEAVLGHMLAKR